MGMYATINGSEIKMYGLLAKVVISLASGRPDEFPGVELTTYEGHLCLDGGVVVLSRENVNLVVLSMRNGFVYQGRTGEYTVWAEDKSNFGTLTHLQDIYQFRADVEAFTILAGWLVSEAGKEIVFA